MPCPRSWRELLCLNAADWYATPGGHSRNSRGGRGAAQVGRTLCLPFRRRAGGFAKGNPKKVAIYDKLIDLGLKTRSVIVPEDQVTGSNIKQLRSKRRACVVRVEAGYVDVIDRKAGIALSRAGTNDVYRPEFLDQPTSSAPKHVGTYATERVAVRRRRLRYHETVSGKDEAPGKGVQQRSDTRVGGFVGSC